MHTAASQRRLAKPVSTPVIGKCRVCASRLNGNATQTSLAKGVCGNCEKSRQEMRRRRPAPQPEAQTAVPARNFTAADRALIRRIGSSLPPTLLLEILNERLGADLGPQASPYTLEQLQREFQNLPGPADGNDWASLRQMISRARRDGSLELITAQSIDDFAVVFALSPAQVLRLKDVLLSTAN